MNNYYVIVVECTGEAKIMIIKRRPKTGKFVVNGEQIGSDIFGFSLSYKHYDIYLDWDYILCPIGLSNYAAHT